MTGEKIDVEEDATDLLDWQFERQNQRVKSLPIEAQLDLQRRIDQCKAVLDTATRVYSRYWQARSRAERQSRRLINIQDPVLLFSLAVAVLVFVLGYRAVAVLIVAVALLALAVRSRLLSRSEASVLKPLVAEIEELKQRWVAAGASGDVLDTFGLTLLDHANECVPHGKAREFSIWWNQVEACLTDVVERAIRQPALNAQPPTPT